MKILHELFHYFQCERDQRAKLKILAKAGKTQPIG